MKAETMTTAAGRPLADNHNSGMFAPRESEAMQGSAAYGTLSISPVRPLRQVLSGCLP